MPTSLLEFYEAVEDDARMNFQFDMTGGSAKGIYYTPTDSDYNVQDIVASIIGYTNPFVSSTQAMRRTVPVTHPKCPYMYAHRVTSLLGKGSGTAKRQAPIPPTWPTIGVNPIADYFKYRQYEVSIDFSSRPYPIISDSDFSPSFPSSWYTADGTLNNFTYAPEWVRYCDFDYAPQNNTLQGSQGAMSMFNVAGTSGPISFINPPWMWLPDMILKIKWYQVPYRYIISSNSYIASTPARNWRGRVNQNWFWNWAPGSLLYMSYQVQKYTPPTFDIGTYPSWKGDIYTGPTLLGNLLNYERLCDIELTFLYTSRVLSGSLGATLTNKNYVPGGHNLLPNISNGKFYYATRNPIGSTTGNIQNPPAWLSFPLEALFSDPDASGGPTTTGDTP